MHGVVNSRHVVKGGRWRVQIAAWLMAVVFRYDEEAGSTVKSMLVKIVVVHIGNGVVKG